MKFIGPNMGIGHCCEGPAFWSFLNIIDYKIFMITLAPQRQFQHPSLAIGGFFYLNISFNFIFYFYCSCISLEIDDNDSVRWRRQPPLTRRYCSFIKIF